MISPEQIIAVLGIVLPISGGVVGWSLKRHQEITKELGGHDKRLALVEHSFGDLKELLNTRFDATIQRLDARFDASDYRLERVEKKVLNGDYHQ